MNKYFLLLLLALPAFGASVRDGGESSGGGDVMRLDLESVRQFVLTRVDVLPNLNEAGLTAAEFTTQLSSVKIKSVSGLPTLVEASDNTLLVNRESWMQTEEGTVFKSGILIHGLFFLLGKEQLLDYSLTRPIVTNLGLISAYDTFHRAPGHKFPTPHARVR